MFKKTLTTVFVSMLCAANVQAATPTYFIMGYYSNWNIYSNDAATRAIPEPAYGIPGSYASDGSVVTNQDMIDKLAVINALTYDFFQVQTTGPHIGALYFSDPNADLRMGDTQRNPITNQFCASSTTAYICNYAQEAATWGRGNFEAFSKLQNGAANLRKLISVGGYGHDISFETTFASDAAINEFVTSAAAIVSAYKIQGIDLDYENTDTSAARSYAPRYVQLVKALRTALGGNALITVTILANPDWIASFGAENWKQLVGQANYINLMTYDFHGSWDYGDPAGTGYLSNIYLDPNDTHAQKFSVEAAVQALQQQGIPNNMIVIGVPAYGRALEGVPNVNHGLYQPFAQIAKGDLDPANCVQQLPLQANACSGAFQYNYIVNKMLNPGVTFTDYTNYAGPTNAPNAVWAYNPNAWSDASTGGKTAAGTFISYDNLLVAQTKANYVKDNGLGGVIMWELRGDVSPTTKDKNGQSPSLLAKIYSIIGQ